MILHSDIAIILVSPQMGENIGAAARAMKNFGVSDLRLVAPRDGWPNERADSMSVFAIDIIRKAKIFVNIQSAIEDLEWIYATSSAKRDMQKEVVVVNDLNNNDLTAIFQYAYPTKTQHKKIGIMFGKESSGLSNDDIAYANQILTINTRLESGSLNIAHAVAVICYEFSKLFSKDLVYQNQNEQKNANIELANSGDMEYCYKQLFELLENSNFFRVGVKQEYVQQKIRNIFNRIPNLSKSELQILRGILSKLSCK